MLEATAPPTEPQPLSVINKSFLKNGPILPLFVYFRSFLVTISIQIEKSIDGVLGIQPGPQDGRCRQNHGAMAATQ